jgi:hypothetical protein
VTLVACQDMNLLDQDLELVNLRRHGREMKLNAKVSLQMLLYIGKAENYTIMSYMSFQYTT